MKVEIELKRLKEERRTAEEHSSIEPEAEPTPPSEKPPAIPASRLSFFKKTH